MAGCASVETPDQVARHFWDAMKEGDEKTVQNYTTEETRMFIKLSDFRWPNGYIAFDEIRITGNDAMVDTQIGQDESAAMPIASFQTVLKRKDGTWKVDYRKTMSTVSDNNGFSELMRDMRKFNREFSENLDDALAQLKKEAPKLEKEVESLSNSIGKSLEKFAQKLDKLLKDSQNKNDSRSEKEKSI